MTTNDDLVEVEGPVRGKQLVPRNQAVLMETYTMTDEKRRMWMHVDDAAKYRNWSKVSPQPHAPRASQPEPEFVREAEPEKKRAPKREERRELVREAEPEKKWAPKREERRELRQKRSNGIVMDGRAMTQEEREKLLQGIEGIAQSRLETYRQTLIGYPLPDGSVLLVGDPKKPMWEAWAEGHDCAAMQCHKITGRVWGGHVLAILPPPRRKPRKRSL